MAAAEKPATFAEHIHELRSRLMWSLLFVAIGAGVGYLLHGKILQVLQQPLNEQLYYTTPTGAFSFIIRICCVFGFIVALPMVVYQTFAFFEPLVKVRTRRLFAFMVVASVALACAGIAFAYFISLPAALKFLVNFGNEGGKIQALITANEYFNFVFAYIAGFAVLFQLPLLLIFINKIKPLTPSKLLGATRYVVLGSFIIAAVITPTPDPFNQLLMAGPVILLYFVSACIVSIMNSFSNRKTQIPIVPEIPTAGLEELLMDGELTSAPLPMPTPAAPVVASSQPAVAAAPAAPVQAAAPAYRPMRRTMDGMLVPTRRTTTTPYQQRTVARPISVSQPASRPRMSVISDFMPAAES